MENVCLATDEDAHMYAVGSKANIDLLDARTLQAIKKIPSRYINIYLMLFLMRCYNFFTYSFSQK